MEGDSNHNLTADIVICRAAPLLGSLKQLILRYRENSTFLKMPMHRLTGIVKRLGKLLEILILVSNYVLAISFN
jgi:hypothetical protein